MCLASACATPISVKRLSARAVQRALTANALSTGRASEWTRNTVNAWGLLERFDDDPDAALAELRGIVVDGRGGAPELFALAELSFLRADDRGDRRHYLAAVAYAYAFLFPKPPVTPPAPLDPRTRIAADLYNRALTQAFASPDRRTVELRAGTYPLPFGEVEVWTDPRYFYWGDRRLVGFVPTAELQVRGLRNRYRLPGIGAPP